MKNHIKIILLVIGWCAAPAEADRLCGLARMERLDQLPVFPEGTQVRQVSSHDRAGGNDDGFIGTYSALYVDDRGEYVLFDEIGAGCIYRFWMTYGSTPTNYPERRLRFYYDNEETPRLDLSIADFFDGVGAPLEFPLAGPFSKSSHGCYCYLPFPYRERLKITLSDLPYFYNITYHRFDSAEGVSSWTGAEDTSAVLAQWNGVGNDPKPAVSNLAVSGVLSLTNGAEGVLFQVDGAGSVRSIRLDPSPNAPELLAGLRLRMNWDGGPMEVDVPLRDFFGSGSHEFNVLSLPVGMRTAGDWYCYFPMPYWASADIRLVNESGMVLSNMPFEVQYSTNVYDRARTGSFHALFRQQVLNGDGTDFLFIEESGRGQVVGVSLFMESTGAGGYKDMNYLEGDERAYVDGSRSPCIHGTGTEDYFNCGWYFNQGLFSRPYHGHPWHDQFHDDAPNYTQAYRMHVSDSIPFNRSVRFGIEHGHANASPGIYSSITYYYLSEAAVLVPLADIDPGDVWSEDLHDYQPPASGGYEAVEWAYPGDAGDGMLQDGGYTFSNSLVSFRVPLKDDLAGLLLRRRCDQGIGGQKAHVFVDDAYAGIWYDADANYAGTQLRWLDSEFAVASNLVAGKTEAVISIAPLASPWNECRYWAYGIGAPQWIEDADGDGLPDAYEMETVASLAVLSGTSDFDHDGFSDSAEYISGTHPTNPASFFRIRTALEFQSSVGRLYGIEECTNMASNVWNSVRADIPGTGGLIPLPVSSGHPDAFYRLKVEKP